MDTIELTADMTAAAINTKLKKGGDFIFRCGVYMLEKSLYLYSNTHVMCEKGVVFIRNHSGRMLQAKATPETTGYNGQHDINWEGGTFIASTNEANANVLTFFHCKNIYLYDINIIGCKGMHSIEINACSNVHILSCYIYDQTNKGKETYREAIQLDFANYDGLKVSDASCDSPCYDGTHCSDITIMGCIFKAVPNGIGTHTVCEGDGYHSGLMICNCLFRYVQGWNVKLNNFRGVVIEDSGTDVLVNDSLDEAHKLTGGKVKIEPKRNRNIRIDNMHINCI